MPGLPMMPSGPGIGVGAPPPDRVDPSQQTRRQRYVENRQKDLNLSWKRWLRDRYARYWFLLGCLLLDLVVAGTVLQVFTGSPIDWWQYALAIALVIALAYPEYLGYQRLWPPAPLE